MNRVSIGIEEVKACDAIDGARLCTCKKCLEIGGYLEAKRSEAIGKDDTIKSNRKLKNGMWKDGKD